MQADQIIGPYKVVFPIKKGLYAETYRVTNEMGEKYFLKLINLAKLSDLQVEGSIENVIERGIIKNIAHPNITKMVDSGETIIDGQRYVYIICDYIVGETVQPKIRNYHPIHD